MASIVGGAEDAPSRPAEPPAAAWRPLARGLQDGPFGMVQFVQGRQFPSSDRSERLAFQKPHLRARLATRSVEQEMIPPQPRLMRFPSALTFTAIGLFFAPEFALFAQPTPAPRFEAVPTQGPRTIFSDPTLRPMGNPGGPGNFSATLPIDLRGNGQPDLFVAYALSPPIPPQKMPVRVFRPQPDGSITEITRQLFGSGTLPSIEMAYFAVLQDYTLTEMTAESLRRRKLG